jgi:outer membrane murein-binding lipoprotein Lpp
MDIIDTRIDEIYEELATLAEAHMEYVGGCLTEEEYDQVCAEADQLNAELNKLYKSKEV